MTYMKTALYKAFGNVYIPNSILSSREDKLLHISDTPVSFYAVLSRIIGRLNPRYIVHTGDLADNIKLGMCPRCLPVYRDCVKKMISVLEASEAEDIFIALGNHDDREAVRSFNARCRIIDTADTVLLERERFRVSHYPEEILRSPEKFNLYGHDLSLRSGRRDNRVYLNGISGINIMEMNSKKCHSLPYPQGIDDDRLGKGKIGL